MLNLQDGTSKMSKSAESDLSRINLLDDPATVESKCKKAKTDAFAGLEFDNPERPESHNLLSIYHLVTGMGKVRTSHDGMLQCAPLVIMCSSHTAGVALARGILQQSKLTIGTMITVMPA